MSDQKQNPTSGKPNKFGQQNKQAEERKASAAAREPEPTEPLTGEPATEREASKKP